VQTETAEAGSNRFEARSEQANIAADDVCGGGGSGKDVSEELTVKVEGHGSRLVMMQVVVLPALLGCP
jgi:hypothetical protein